MPTTKAPSRHKLVLEDEERMLLEDLVHDQLVSWHCNGCLDDADEAQQASKMLALLIKIQDA
jgi:hypothetical protein